MYFNFIMDSLLRRTLVKEPVHGRYQLGLNKNRVTCVYSEGFNVTGVKQLTNDLLRMTAGLSYWVLFQRPEPSAGIIQDAIPEMMQGYVKLQQSGCLAVGIVERSIFVFAGIPYHPKELVMPINIHPDESKILRWLDEIEMQHRTAMSSLPCGE